MMISFWCDAIHNSVFLLFLSQTHVWAERDVPKELDGANLVYRNAINTD